MITAVNLHLILDSSIHLSIQDKTKPHKNMCNVFPRTILWLWLKAGHPTSTSARLTSFTSLLLFSFTYHEEFWTAQNLAYCFVLDCSSCITDLKCIFSLLIHLLPVWNIRWLIKPILLKYWRGTCSSEELASSFEVLVHCHGQAIISQIGTQTLTAWPEAYLLNQLYL